MDNKLSTQTSTCTFFLLAFGWTDPLSLKSIWYRSKYSTDKAIKLLDHFPLQRPKIWPSVFKVPLFVFSEDVQIFGMCDVWLSMWQAKLMLQCSDNVGNFIEPFLSISANIFYINRVSVFFSSLLSLFCMQIVLTKLLQRTDPNKLKFFHHKTEVEKFMRIFCPQMSFFFYFQSTVHPSSLCNPKAIIHLDPPRQSSPHSIPKRHTDIV